VARALWLLLLVGCDSGGGGAATSAPHAICDQYVACVGQTTPQGLAAVLAAYGSSGACWTSAAQSVCLEACRTGLRDTSRAFPKVTACIECLGNDDCSSSPNGHACSAGKCVQCSDDSFCSGQTPACSGGKCVACTENAHCAGHGVCDRGRATCVACGGDSDCPSSAPRCDRSGSAPRCVGCLRSSDCPGGGSCEGGSCCQPETCAELANAWHVDSICGTTYSLKCSNANVTCAGCSRGTCDSTDFNPPQCTSEGTSCMPGMSGACLSDEVCTYVPNVHGYQCAKDRRGSTCVYGGPSQNCGDNRFSCDGANLVNDGVCRAYCLTVADCRSTEKCSMFSGLGYGECI
jgi:hypothetical protein